MAARETPSECRAFAKRLSRYADGDLTVAEAEESRLHLESCPNCAARFEAHKRMILLLESSREVEAPWDLDLKVLEAIGFGGARTQLRGYRVSPPLVWAASVAAMILVGAGGLALRSGVARVISALFGPAGVLSTEEMAGLASKITRSLVMIWDGILSGLSVFQPLFRSLGAVSDAAWDNPVVMGTMAGTVVLVLMFFRIMTKGRRSRAVMRKRRDDASSTS